MIEFNCSTSLLSAQAVNHIVCSGRLSALWRHDVRRICRARTVMDRPYFLSYSTRRFTSLASPVKYVSAILYSFSNSAVASALPL